MGEADVRARPGRRTLEELQRAVLEVLARKAIVDPIAAATGKVVGSSAPAWVKPSPAKASPPHTTAAHTTIRAGAPTTTTKSAKEPSRATRIGAVNGCSDGAGVASSARTIVVSCGATTSSVWVRSSSVVAGPVGSAIAPS